MAALETWLNSGTVISILSAVFSAGGLFAYGNAKFNEIDKELLNKAGNSELALINRDISSLVGNRVTRQDLENINQKIDLKVENINTKLDTVIEGQHRLENKFIKILEGDKHGHDAG